MMRSQFNTADLSAILSGTSSAQTSNGNSAMANLLLNQHQQQQQQQQQAAASNLASLNAAFSAPSPANAPSSAAPTHNGQSSQATALLTALLQQQQREDQKKAALLSQLAALRQPPSPADNLAAILQAKQIAMPGAMNHQADPLASLLGANASSLFGGQQAPPTHGGQLDAAAISKLVQSQQQQQPTPAVPTSSAQLGAAGSATSVLLDGSSDRPRKGRTGTFPQKLHQMLSDLERQEGGTDIASFLPHGRAFAIHKPRDFVKHVMSKYFRMSRFSSFQRQLNLYDFQRITEGPDKGSYYHELFVQGRPILSTMMKRNKIKGVKNLKQQQQQQQGQDDEAKETEEIAAPPQDEEGEDEE
mmetsp:Transcript_17291/g.37744  ORF Transcript_17291/g.37744 Transcript_17291/m.37744 type:complete len:359 (+) Transcript_17291:94-1170(+)